MDAVTYNLARAYTPAVIENIQRLLEVEPTGSWNEDTITAVREFQAENELVADGKVGPTTLAAIQVLDRQDHAEDEDENQDEDDDVAADPLRELRAWCLNGNAELLDYRDLAQWPRNKIYPKEYGSPRNKQRAQPKDPRAFRSWSTITTFMLHTTAVGGMTGKRGLGLPCHFFVPKENTVVLCHEMERRLAHGHTANRFTVGLEISGVSDWDAPSQIERTRQLLRYFQAVRRARVGHDAKCYVMAHRQSHWSRVRDPGKQIWQDAGEWAIEELGFELGPVVGSGKDLDEWRMAGG